MEDPNRNLSAGTDEDFNPVFDDDVISNVTASGSYGHHHHYPLVGEGSNHSVMERRRPQFSQFLRPSLSAKMREITSASAKSERDKERDREGESEREKRFSASGLTTDEPELLVRQNQDLRRRLEEESNNYKKRLDSYKQAQQHQAALVSRLQAKILQYKQKCSALENQLDLSGAPDSPAIRSSSALPLPPPGGIIDDMDLDTDAALRLLDEERRKNERLKQLNTALKEQLEEAHGTNESLTTDLQKLHNDWERLREEMLAKEEEWKEEENAFHDYYTNEHSRLLGLWREVVCVKRSFTELHSLTERDLVRLRDTITSTSKDFTRTCANVMTNTALAAKSEEKQALHREHEVAELRTQIQAMKSEFEASMLISRQKDERIQMLQKELQSMEERCRDAEQNVTQVIHLQQEADHLQNALRDIAHAVLRDAEAREATAGNAAGGSGEAPPPPHLHLTPPPPPHATSAPRSPKRNQQRTPASPAFAESTLSAVQAALGKYQLMIHELQVKLQTHKEQCAHLKKQFDSADEAQHSLSTRLSEVTTQYDAARAQITHLQQEKEMLLKSLETVRGEKSALEKNRVEMNSLAESLHAELDKQQKVNVKQQKLLDALEDEKTFLQEETARLSQDNSTREADLRAFEEKCSRLREDLLITREDLSKASLERDMLFSQKVELENAMAQVEKNKGDVELELEKLALEKTDLQESFDKAENRCTNLEQEKKRLLDKTSKLESDKVNLHNQITDQQNDLASLRKELLQAEQTRLDLESEKITLLEKIKFLEVEKEKIEIELAGMTRERSDLNNQLAALARKRDALNEENMRLRQRLEQSTETNSRINRNLEDLVKDNEEKQVVLEANEKDIRRLQEQLAASRSDKESLEGVLFDTQTNLEACEIKRFQLEKDNQDLLIKQETLRGQVARLTKDFDDMDNKARENIAALHQRLQEQEAEHQQIVDNIRQLNEETTRKLNDEKEQVKLALEKKIQSSVQHMASEKEKEIEKLNARIETLQQHVENLCQQHEEILLRAENEKQQALLLAHHDQQALTDKLESCQKELEEEKGALERTRREAASRTDQDRGIINSLREELGSLKTKLEELRIQSNEEKERLESRIEETKSERDAALIEMEEIKVHLNLAEEKGDSLQNQFQETVRRLKENETICEGLRKDLTDVRRQLSDSNFEKEKYNSSNKELREHVKRSETDKRETQRALEEAFQKIAALEDARTSLETEKARLQGHLREQERQNNALCNQLQSAQDDLSKAKSASSTMANEDKERQARLHSEIEERERAQQELHMLKKQIVELDNSLEVARQEMLRLRQRGDEEEARWRHREQELLLRLEDLRTRERKLEDQKHNLEVCLADATQQIQEIKARLGGTEGRVKALEQQLQQMESAKKEIEQKLTSVVTTLRRIAGIQFDGSVTLPFKLLSPSRRWSPARTKESAATPKSGGRSESREHHHHGHCHEGHGDISDLDPEAIRKGVRTLMQQVAQVERERDDYKTSLAQMKKQLNDGAELQTKGDEKLNQVLHNLRLLQEEKGSLEAKLGQKQAALQAQNETLQAKAHEVQSLRDKVTTLELAVHSSTEEKAQYEEKIEKMRSSLSRLESEKRSLQEELSRTESRATKLELHRMALEGDLQRLQMMLQDKDSQIQKSHEKLETQNRNLTNLEERCASLKLTIEQLNVSLERASANESEFRNEITSLQRTLQEANANVAAGNDKLKQMQKSLSTSENERRVLAERLDATQQSLADVRRNYQSLQEQLQRLQNDLANNELQRASLETQLRHATSSSTNVWNDNKLSSDDGLLRQLQTAQKEKIDLRGKVDFLSDKIRQLESDKRSLERTVSKTRSKSIERSEKGPYSLDINELEQENRELRLKIRRLESQLAEKEAELARLKSHKCPDLKGSSSEVNRMRNAQLQAERLLDSREQAHRQQVLRLENQIQLLREQLNQEIKRRQLYVLRSARTGREVQQIRQALDDSLRTVSQDPQLDSVLLEHEARKLDSSTSLTSSQQPSSMPLPLPPPTSAYDFSISHHK